MEIPSVRRAQTIFLAMLLLLPAHAAATSVWAGPVQTQTATASANESEAEANVAQALRKLNLEGWNARPMETFPKHVGAQDSAADTTPAFQLYGLEPHIYDILAEFGVRKCYKRTYQRGQRFVQAAV
ncbi:MAG: hypothetical protein IT342_26375, partial [Candidatus Melainabacteria bacterium]|nr:hypothetical protein [Candidatus Melainabacteria bacterium]